jgi:hypothetical protein
MDALRKAGAEVTSLHQVGGGVPDLLVSYRNKWHVIEVKDGSKPPSARMLTDDQRKWMIKQRASVWVVTSPEEALSAVGAPEKR